MSQSQAMRSGHRPLDGRIALVTGSSRNIGRAIALAYAQAGADVVVHGRTSEAEVNAVAEEVRTLGQRAVVSIADVRDATAVRRFVAQATEVLGPIDVLVNNAAVRRERSFDTMAYEDWQEGLAVTLDGAFHCTQAVIGGMLAMGRGSIVNVVGLTAHTGAANRAHVVTAKAGIIGFTRALAVEYGSRGITVNGVSPGLIDTMRGDSAGNAEPAHRQERVIPVGRRGQPEEVAAMCVYLASQPARYITGQIFEVNGGAHM